MARSPEQDKIFKEERRIGLQAARKAERYLLAVIKQKLHIRNQGGEEGPILKVTKVRRKMGDYRLLGLDLTSSKVGFILNYGFVGVREATTVYLDDPRFHLKSTQRKRHRTNLPERNILENIYIRSGAVDHLVEGLSKTRLDAIRVSIEGMVLKFNEETDG